MRNKQPPAFDLYEVGPDFDRARDQIATPFTYYDIALDVTTSNFLLNISGDFLYVDSSSTGILTAELNNQYSDKQAPFQLQSGFAMQAIFKQLRLSWTAQPGKTIRLLYSTGERVIPAGVIASINQIVQPVNINDVVSSNCFHNYMLLTDAVGTSVMQLVAPGANPNGMVLRGLRGGGNGSAAGTSINTIVMAALTAPTNLNSKSNAIALSYLAQTGTVFVTFDEGQIYRKIPAGWGLWIVDNVVGAGTSNIAIFTEYEIL